MADQPAANNATTFKLAMLAMLLSLWMIGRASEPDAPPPPTDEELLAAIENSAGNNSNTGGDDPVREANVGHIRGIVTFLGERPEAKPINLSTDPYCLMYYDGKPTLRSESWVINSAGGLANVLVHVTGGLPDRAWSPPAEAKIVRVEGCRYEPHVTAMMLGQWVEFQNNDETLHSAHYLPAVNPEPGIGQPARGQPMLRWQPTRPETGVMVKCDVHAWMNCRLHILDHPFFAVTNPRGEFEISNLPPGEYEITAVHEVKNAKFSRMPMKIKVEAGKTTQVTIEASR